MGIVNLVTRVDAICKKYEKYDVNKQKEADNINLLSDDAFARLYDVVAAEIEEALQKAEAVRSERNRARVVAINAEIRRTKARLLDQIPKLQRLSYKKVKGLSQEELEARSDLVSVLKERIEAIPDGSTTVPKQNAEGATSALPTRIRFNSASGKYNSEFFQQTEESNKFREEYEMRKIRQDEGLDDIAEGLDTLKDMAKDMNEELDRQVPLMDEIDDKVDRANSDLRNANVQLKDTITQLRSSRNFCIDIILLCIILGIAAYLYNVMK